MKVLLHNKNTYRIVLLLSIIMLFPNQQSFAIKIDREIDTQSPYINLRLRKTTMLQSEDNLETEKDMKYIYWKQKIPISQVAFLLMDVWATHGNDGLAKRMDKNVREKLFPIVQAARKKGILMIHSPHGHPIHPLLKPKPGEIVIKDMPELKGEVQSETEQLIKILEENNILFLVYVGYTSNMCLMYTGTGLLATKDHSFMNILVRDASIAVEMPLFLPAEITHAISVYTIELNSFATTTTVDHFLYALENIQQPQIKE